MHSIFSLCSTYDLFENHNLTKITILIVYFSSFHKQSNRQRMLVAHSQQLIARSAREMNFARKIARKWQGDTRHRVSCASRDAVYNESSEKTRHANEKRRKAWRRNDVLALIKRVVKSRIPCFPSIDRLRRPFQKRRRIRFTFEDFRRTCNEAGLHFQKEYPKRIDFVVRVVLECNPRWCTRLNVKRIYTDTIYSILLCINLLRGLFNLALNYYYLKPDIS